MVGCGVPAGLTDWINASFEILRTGADSRQMRDILVRLRSEDLELL